MAAHIPEHRQVMQGRTFDREWEPCAVEHYRRPSRSVSRLMGYGCVVLLALVALSVWSAQ